MLARILLRSPALRSLRTLRRHLPPHSAAAAFRPFSTGGGGGGGGGGNDDWKDGKIESWHFPDDQPDNDIFGTDSGDLSGISDEPVEKPLKLVDDEEPSGDVFGHIDAEFASGGGRADDDWLRSGDDGPAEKLNLADEEKPSGDVFGHIDEEFASGGRGRGADDDWLRGGDDEKSKPWSFDADTEEVEKLFDVSAPPPGRAEDFRDDFSDEEEPKVDLALVKEEQYLSSVLKGPDRAFGDLISASGITESMLDSLMILKDLEDIPGLPPLSEIEDIRLAKSKKTNLRAEIERKKQEEIAKSYVRKVDDKGRSYGTGRRKCGIARVWIQPGDGKFIVNDKPFDVYFPILDHRAALLRPFTETKTLGCWDVKCTVKGGGLSGQVGAIRLGISRALQNWEPGLRPYLKEAGFMTRDPRVVERKKPGKAKARKSFQWVKR